jgi:hypothetical protein
VASRRGVGNANARNDAVRTFRGFQAYGCPPTGRAGTGPLPSPGTWAPAVCG